MTKEKNNIQVLLLNISRSYKDGMNEEEIYKCVRRAWGKPSREVNYVLAITHSKVRGVFRILRWYEDKREPKLWAFDGEKAPIDICKKYENKKFRMCGPIGYTF